jgi:hypothetical protein
LRPPLPTRALEVPARHMPASHAPAGPSLRGGAHQGSPDLSELRNVRGKRNAHEFARKRSVLVRQRGRGDASPFAQELAHLKKASPIHKGTLAQKAGMAQKPGAKDLLGLKKANLTGRKATLKSRSPVRSALIRQKPHAGDLSKVTALAKGGLDNELAQFKKVSPIHKRALAQKPRLAQKPGAKDLAGLKKAAMKSMSPAKSALVRHKSHAAHLRLPHAGELAGVAGGLGGELRHLKKPGRRAQAVPGRRRRGALTIKAKATAKGAGKVGRREKGLR